MAEVIRGFEIEGIKGEGIFMDIDYIRSMGKGIQISIGVGSPEASGSGVVVIGERRRGVKRSSGGERKRFIFGVEGEGGRGRGRGGVFSDGVVVVVVVVVVRREKRAKKRR